MQKETRKVAQALLLIVQLGFEVIVTVFLCIWFGGWLDRKFGTGFWLIVFLILGLITAYRNAYVLTKSFYTKGKSEKEKQQDYIDSLTRGREKNGRR